MTATKAPKKKSKSKKPQGPPSVSYYEVLAAATKASFWRFVREFWSQVPGASEPVWNWHMEHMCETLQRHAERVFAGLPKEADVIYNVPPGTSKPLWDGTSVMMGDGTWQRLDRIKVGDMVIGKSGKPCRVSAVHVQGELEAVQITTFGGRALYAALDHPILTTDGWVNAGSIGPRHHLALMHTPKVTHDEHGRFDDEFTLAGYLIGDGSLSHGNCCVTGKDPDYLQDVVDCVTRLGFGYRVAVTKNGVTTINLKDTRGPDGRGPSPRQWVRDVGIDGLKSGTKRVPDFVWKGSDRQVALFLAAYFHCDGCVSYRDTTKRNLTVSVCTISSKLAKGVQRLLLRLGIAMRIRERVAKSGFSYNRGLTNYRYYTVDTTDQDAASRFLEKIPLKGYKKAKLEGFAPHRRTFDQQYWPDPVRSVEDWGKVSCRCLTVEDDASFVAEGIVVHNSTVCSILFHCWIWARMPQARFMSASHASDLVLDLSAKARDVITSERYRRCFTYIELSSDQDAKGYYRNTLGGDRFTCTVSGKSPVGFHADFQVIDDAIDPKRARSEVHKQTAKEFITDVLPGRKRDKAITFTMLVMQRLGVGDPTDVMIEVSKQEGSAPLEHYCLPAELADNVSPPELAARYVDGLLDPKRLSRAVLKREQASMGPYAYAGQYGQRPFLPGGGMFKSHWFATRKAAPYKSKRVFGVDRASTPDGGCYTAGVLMARDDEGNYYVEDVIHGQWDPDERNKNLKAALMRYRRKYGKYEPKVHIESEGGSSGRDAFRLLAKDLAGFNVREVRVTGAKDVRAEPWAAQLAAGNVYLIDNGASEGNAQASWDIDGFILEHVAFKPDPHSKRLGGLKDRVDACSLSFNVLCQGVGRGELPLRKFTFRDPDRRTQEPPKFLLCSYEEFSTTVIDVPCIVIHVHDPVEGEGPYAVPESGCANVLGHVGVCFADVDPEEMEELWDQHDEALGKRPSELCLSREIARSIWSLVLRKYDPVARVVVFVGDDRRAASICHGVADGLRFERAKVYLSSDPSDISKTGTDAPSNRHAYEAVKAARHSVIG